MRLRQKVLVVVALGLLAAACSDPDLGGTVSTTPTAIVADEADEAETSTSTATSSDAAPLLGLTAFPSSPTTDGIVRAFALAESDGSLVAHHFDGGIPWVSLISGEPIPEPFREELEARRSASEGQAVYVATAITNFERDDIPDGLNGTPRPASLDGAGPGTPAVEQALIAWIDVLVGALEPDYLNVAVELDLAVAKRPDLRDDLIGLYRRLYEHVKANYPEVVVFASFQAELGDPDVVAAVADATDLIAISTYPYFDGSLRDDDFLDLDRFSGFGVDVAIAETGYPSGRAATPTGDVESSPRQQEKYVTWLLDQACSRQMEFVVWFLPTDIDVVAWNYPPALEAVAAVFANNGLYSVDGTPRPARDVWTKILEAGCPT